MTKIKEGEEKRIKIKTSFLLFIRLNINKKPRNVKVKFIFWTYFVISCFVV